MYKLITTLPSKEICGVTNLETNTHIPFDQDNTDYQEYLKWLAEGNEPLPADNNQ